MVEDTVFQSGKKRDILSAVIRERLLEMPDPSQYWAVVCSQICLFMFEHALMCSCKNVSFLSCFLGENVNEFFSRVAALAFEQSMIKELEKTVGHVAQIGTGNLISMLNFASCVYFPQLCSQGLGRFYWASKPVSQSCKRINFGVFLSSDM